MKTTAMRASAARKTNSNISRTMLKFLFCLALQLGVLALLIAALAQLISKVNVPLELIPALATFACCAATLLASVILAKLHGKQGLLCGFVLGVILFAILWISALTQGQTVFTTYAAIKGSSIVLSGAVGGLLGSILSEKSRRIH